jgi:sulfonate transport system substrate-binding protein
VDLKVGYVVIGLQPLLDASGIFKNTPYNVEWVQFQAAGAIATGVQNGSLELGYGVGDASVAIAQGNANPPWTKGDVPLVVTTAMRYMDPSVTPEGLFVSKSSGIKKLSDLRGKKIAYSAGSSIELMFNAVLQKAHLTKSDVTPVNLASVAGNAAFLGGQVDAIVAPSAIAKPLLDAGAKDILDANAFDYLPGDAFIVAPPKVLGDPSSLAALKDLTTRLAKFNNWLYTHEDKAAGIAAPLIGAKTNEDAVIYINAIARKPVPITPQLIATYQRQADSLHAGGIIATDPDIGIAMSTVMNSVVAALPPTPQKVVKGGSSGSTTGGTTTSAPAAASTTQK